MPNSFRRRARLSASSLIEEDDPVDGWVEETAVLGIGAAAGATVQEDRWFSVRVARLFPVDLMTARYCEVSRRMRVDGGVQSPPISWHARSFAEAGARV
jgi:hypothetical protein